METYETLTLRDVYVSTSVNGTDWQVDLRMYCETTDIGVLHSGTWIVRLFDTNNYVLIHEMVADSLVSGNEEREATVQFQLKIAVDQVCFLTYMKLRIGCYCVIDSKFRLSLGCRTVTAILPFIICQLVTWQMAWWQSPKKCGSVSELSPWLRTTFKREVRQHLLASISIRKTLCSNVSIAAPRTLCTYGKIQVGRSTYKLTMCLYS